MYWKAENEYWLVAELLLAGFQISEIIIDFIRVMSFSAATERMIGEEQLLHPRRLSDLSPMRGLAVMKLHLDGDEVELNSLHFDRLTALTGMLTAAGSVATSM